VIVVLLLALFGFDVTGGGGGSHPFSLGTGADAGAPASDLAASCRTDPGACDTFTARTL
jgi:hypothetical protein